MKALAYVPFILVTACSAPLGHRQAVPSRQAAVAPASVAQVAQVPTASVVAVPTKQQVRREKGIIRHPYTGEQVTVKCPTLRVCDIELQAGETILQVLLGDAKRWFAIPSSHGSQKAVTPHVGVKPTEKGISSNLVVYTDRRAYQFELVEGGKGERIGFLYPEEEQKVIRAEVKPQVLENESYTISGTAPWKPVKVVDDGTRTLITLPESVRVTEMPVLFDVSNGNESLVNYSVRWPVLTVGKVLTQGRLVIGTGWKRQQVEIRRMQ